MKRSIMTAAAAFLMCGSLLVYSPASASDVKNPEPLKIVTTIFPEYDWVKNVLGDEAENAEVTMLLDNGVDPHSYQATVDDILKISSCDLFICVGGESDGWVKDALQDAINPDMEVVYLLDLLGDAAREEEALEGMQLEEAESEETEADEHVWLSLRNAGLFVECIAQTLSDLDPVHEESYMANAEAYTDQLESLDAAFQEAVSEAPVKTLLFGDRFPFRYTTEDYGLTCYAAFPGCSAETEASFETITFLAQKVDELSLHSVLTIEGSDQKIAQTIIQCTKTRDQQILTLDSMQAVTLKDQKEGAAYLSIMEKNLEVLKEALK